MAIPFNYAPLITQSESPFFSEIIPDERQIVCDKIDELLAAGIIRSSCSPFASPIILVKTKDGADRLCVDYRELNNNTVPDRYPLPFINDQIQRLSGAEYFTTLDMASGFHQMPIHEDSVEHTAFVTPDGQYEYLSTPFGLRNASAVFQRAINQAVGELVNTFAICYIDDIMIPCCSMLLRPLSLSVTDGQEIEEVELSAILKLIELGVDLPDVEDNRSVSVLIGADIAGKLFTGRRHILSCGLVALETLLGWTLMGKVPESVDREDATIMVTSMFVRSENIPDLWSLEALGIKDPIETRSQKEHDNAVYDAFLKTIKVNNDGRYEVPLPWLKNHHALNNNKSLAIERLKKVARRLKAEGLYEVYNDVFKEWVDEGIVEYVPVSEEGTGGHYLPHRHVVKEGSTTRIRPVFDASAKERNFPSLNECLEKGPNLIELISSALLRFRGGNIGVISDIKKAFLQISIDLQDRDFLRFLWYDKGGNIVILRHCRVVFGVSSSPFILSAVIDLHLRKILARCSNHTNNQYSKEHVLRLLQNFYVDNCVTSVNTVESLNEFIVQAKAMMEAGGFDLRGWEFNGDNSHANQAAVLGLVWDKQNDKLCLNISALKVDTEKKITKRVILSMAHKIFDPLGFVCPIMLYPRMILQEVWAQKKPWDEEVSEEIKQKFLKWAKELGNLERVRIPRCVLGKIAESDDVSIHIFCDASQVAYAAVVFIRIASHNGVQVNFVHAKARVVPMKRATMPRLELLAACIAARITVTVLESLNFKNLPVHFWSDSSTVLAWIRRDSNWATFVWNRVQEIRKLTRPEQWRHVPGHLNPADLPSRGCTVTKLLNSGWWEGPEWLRAQPDSWPNNEFTYNEHEIDSELKRAALKTQVAIEKGSTFLVTADRVESENFCEGLTSRISSYAKIVRVIAWVRRFSKNCRNKKASRIRSALILTEVDDAEISLLKFIQTNNSIDERNERVRPFYPFRDEMGLIRIKTKILLRDDVYNFRCPIVLPVSHQLVRLLIYETHVSLAHAGIQITMNTLREKFWILGGRKVIRSIIRKCVICKRHDAKSLNADPAPLPVNRVRDAAVFEVVGVDFAGPIYLKEIKKAWICLFTCAVFRAVHLELTTSLSTPCFLEALRRFIGRRGRPSIIYSDNGTNFVGLDNLFKHIDFTELSKALVVRKIEWRFNPPAAPWWGGFWERLIGLLKRLLKRVLGKACLSYEEMLTVLIDCEAVINSRPITFMSDCTQELTPLTPSMFLQEIKEVGVLDCDHIDRSKLDKRFMYRQKVKDDSRLRFRSEYLSELIHKRCKTRDAMNVKVGDIVLVEHENMKRLDWPLAKVRDLIIGTDNKVRVVRLTTATGELVRPIQRIYPLELGLDSTVAAENVGKTGAGLTEQLNPRSSSDTIYKDVFLDSNNKTRSGREIKKPQRYED